MNEYTPQERSALVTFHLMQGRQMTTREVASLTGLTYAAAWNMLNYRLCRVLPLRQDDEGVWELNKDDCSLMY